MGIYLVGVGAAEWFGGAGDGGAGGGGDGFGEDGFGEIAAELGAALADLGLPAFAPVSEEAASAFEEKLSPPSAGFDALCRELLSREQYETLTSWSVLVPFPLPDELWLPGGPTPETTMVAGAPQVLAIAERVATAIGLPVADLPTAPEGLELTGWFLDGPAAELAAVRPGRWSADLAASFYAALFLRAAQHAIRHGCPMAFC
ncbi:hypothetical protein [Kitasatospora viridis]|uniref:Uncharacterized protein n=1 Tax=Kitasatospora viridis TaxID=281105 RepID=A0A561SEW5_9ACTN|nr:hypothetical protein [Kitasatospora viridis]TWF73406.1 hypothetical protein FHX73_1517 [Kitasatospora viridis]